MSKGSMTKQAFIKLQNEFLKSLYSIAARVIFLLSHDEKQKQVMFYFSMKFSIRQTWSFKHTAFALPDIKHVI